MAETRNSRKRGALRSLGIRCRAGLAFELEQEARANGRSLAMECEMRLEASLRPGPDLSTLIREEIRAALEEWDEAVPGERQVDVPGQLYRY